MNHNNNRVWKEEEEPLVLERSRNYWTFHNHKQKHSYDSMSSRLFYSSRIVLALFLFVGAISSWQRRNNTPEHRWNRWDYNAYHPITDSFSFLLAQEEDDDDDDDETDVTSLPNRAYARERKLDYVRFHDILLPWSYDIIAFFPSNAILIHLDHSLRELLPNTDQVMTLGHATGFFALNMRHAETAQIMAQWPRFHTLSSLRSFLLSHVPPAWISYLPEQPNGWVGSHRLLQCLPRESVPDYPRALATTVALVCYRYYPKCEIL